MSDSTLALVHEAHSLVDLALRYVAAGGSAILAFGLIQGRGFAFLYAASPQHEISAWLLALFVVVFGIAIYTVHRALLYRLVVLVMYFLIGRAQSTPLGPRALEDKLRDKQYERCTKKDPWVRTFDSWAAECHFLYCSAWGTLAAVALARVSGVPWDATCNIALEVGALLLIAALLQDVRAVRTDLSKDVTQGQ